MKYLLLTMKPLFFEKMQYFSFFFYIRVGFFFSVTWEPFQQNNCNSLSLD